MICLSLCISAADLLNSGITILDKKLSDASVTRIIKGTEQKKERSVHLVSKER